MPQIDNLHSPSVVASHGSFNGTVIGAQVMLLADIGYQNLVNNMEAIAAQYATKLANIETEIQQELNGLQQSYYNQPDVQKAIKDMNAGKPTTADQMAMQNYTTQIGLIQAGIQAATKAIDPTLSTVQNEPSALQQGANEFIQEVGTVNQGMQALANDRIS